MSNDLQRAVNEVKAANAELAKRSFAHFVSQAWPILEPATPYSPGIIHRAICTHLQAVTDGRLSRLIINAPPRMGKSLLVSVLWPIWVWIRYPTARFLCTSFKQDLAISLSEKAQKVVTSEWYLENWGDIVALDKKTAEVFTNTAMGERRMSTYSSAMGFGASGKGSLIVDDPHAIDQVLSDDVRRKDLDVFDTGLSNRVSGEASVVVVMQRLHENDLSGHLLQRGNYEHLFLPNEFNLLRSKITSIGWADPRIEDGELVWPEVFNAEKTAEAKVSYGRFAYEGQMNCVPVSRFGGLVNPAWFKEWTTSTLPETFDDFVISGDLSFKGGKENDYVVFQAWGRHKGEYFLLDQVRGQMDFVKTLDAFESFCFKWGQIRTKLIEDRANGPAVISALKKKIPGILSVNPGRDSKESRVSAISPLIESGNVYIPKHASWKDDFLHEVAMFPKGVHDDQIDALSQALLRLDQTRKRDIIYIRHSIF